MLNVGDYIKCASAEDMADVDIDLCQAGYITEFAYEHNGVEGYYIEIMAVPKEK